MQDRKTLLEIISRYEDPGKLPELRRDLAVYGFGSEAELVTLTSAVIAAVLERYLQGELTAKEVSDWAEFFEQREDMGYGLDDADNKAVQEAIFELATPELEGDLTPQSATTLLENLKAV